MKYLGSLFFCLGMLLPVFVVPVIAYDSNNWYLMFGLFFAWGGYVLSTSSLTGIFTCLCIGVWLWLGFSIYQYITFYYFCYLFGTITSGLAEAYFQEAKNQESSK